MRNLIKKFYFCRSDDMKTVRMNNVQEADTEGWVLFCLFRQEKLFVGM